MVIKKTQKKGWGVFAAERIPKGMFIGIYSGELLGHEESEERAMYVRVLFHYFSTFEIALVNMMNSDEHISSISTGGTSLRS